MFERFTERARQVVVIAQENARTLRYDYIGTEHLLLALADDPEVDLSAEVLVSLGVDSHALRDRIGHGSYSETGPTLGQMPFKPGAKTALELSLREALELGHSYVGTEHVLLGLIGASPNTATELLNIMNLTPEQVRAKVMERLPPPSATHRQTGGSAGPNHQGMTVGALETETRFYAGPDPQLRRALMSAAALALEAGRSQFGIADLNAIIQRDNSND